MSILSDSFSIWIVVLVCILFFVALCAKEISDALDYFNRWRRYRKKVREAFRYSLANNVTINTVQGKTIVALLPQSGFSGFDTCMHYRWQIQRLARDLRRIADKLDEHARTMPKDEV